ncbi:MAG: ribosomal protein S18-alanine N-acetyltransferase [Desulfurococcales archaeon]|nr:ribosomal protein S18-alanine N-acetyltransferase [Desulfurococcales archaeon]
MSETQCEIRPVLPSELILVKKINEATLPENYPMFFYYDIQRMWGDVFLVAVCDGLIVGYIMNRVENHFDKGILLWRTVKVGHIVSVAVLPEYRRRGIASALISKSIKLMRDNYNVKKVYLEVRTSNSPAINLYKKLGFRIKDVIPRYYRDGEDAYLMELEFED